MNLAVISVSALALAVLISCFSRLNVGVLSIAMAWIVGVYMGGLTPAAVMAGFPSQLFLTLTGVTLVFAMAQSNGTLSQLTHHAVRICRGNAGTIPIMFFGLGAALSSMGPGNIATAALLIPIAMATATRAGIPLFLMAIMVGNGANAGALSPFAPTGIIVNGIMATKNHMPGLEAQAFLYNFAAHALMAFGGYFLFGGLKLFRHHTDTPREESEPSERRSAERAGVGSPRATERGPREESEPSERRSAERAGVGSPRATERGPREESEPSERRSAERAGVGSPRATERGPREESEPSERRSAERAGVGSPRATERGPREESDSGSAGARSERGWGPREPLRDDRAFTPRQWITLGVIGALIVSVLAFGANVGLAAFVAAVLLVATGAADDGEAIKLMPWRVIVMVCGVTVLIALVERFQGLDLMVALVTQLSSPGTVTAVVALLTGIVSVYSSTSGVVLPAFLPLVPGLAAQLPGASAAGIAMSMNIGGHLVDVSPLSTIGALCMASASAGDTRKLFNQLLAWGLSMAVFGAVLSYLLF